MVYAFKALFCAVNAVYITKKILKNLKASFGRLDKKRGFDYCPESTFYQVFGALMGDDIQIWSIYLMS